VRGGGGGGCGVCVREVCLRDSINFGKEYCLLLIKYISPFFFMCFKILCVMLFYFCFIFIDVYNFLESWFLLFESEIV
jgi:hypothetical protein